MNFVCNVIPRERKREKKVMYHVMIEAFDHLLHYLCKWNLHDVYIFEMCRLHSNRPHVPIFWQYIKSYTKQSVLFCWVFFFFFGSNDYLCYFVEFSYDVPTMHMTMTTFAIDSKPLFLRHSQSDTKSFEEESKQPLFLRHSKSDTKSFEEESKLISRR